MPGVVTGLFHVAIKTNDLARTRRFYAEVIGLAETARPDFGYPGAWFAVPTPGGSAIVHIYAGGPALGRDGVAPVGSAAIDHISLSCIGFADYVARFRARGLSHREFIVPGTTLWQLFVFDPSGVQLELTFDARVERDAQPDMSEGVRYVAGDNFFRAEEYATLDG
jgi:catechol 2,3-dioxygenase-like lactoylglutathione lyase family enzyme